MIKRLAVMYGKAWFEVSSSQTRLSTSLAFGPHNPMQQRSEDTSTTDTDPSSGRLELIHFRSW